MYAVKATGTLRVSTAGEVEGLDLHEHGMTAYPEFSTGHSPTLSHHMPPTTLSAPVGAPVRQS